MLLVRTSRASAACRDQQYVDSTKGGESIAERSEQHHRGAERLGWPTRSDRLAHRRGSTTLRNDSEDASTRGAGVSSRGSGARTYEARPTARTVERLQNRAPARAIDFEPSSSWARSMAAMSSTATA